MKNKIVKILLISSLSILLTGCDNGDKRFEDITVEHNPINIANPVDVEEETAVINVVEPERSLYYDRYKPEEGAYLPSQLANSSYTPDNNGNNIPNSLLAFDLSRSNLREISELVDNYNIALKNEYTWKYIYPEDGTKNYFTLEKNNSYIGKLKDEDTVEFDSLELKSTYNSSNCNNAESFSLNIKNLTDTAEGIETSTHILKELLPEDMTSILLNYDNDVDSDTKQTFTQSFDTEDKNSTYSFYREFKTPLKESSDKVSAVFDIKFTDSLSKKENAKSTIINNQKEVFNYANHGMDLGELSDKNISSFGTNSNPFNFVLKKLPDNGPKFKNALKEYEHLSYTIFSEDTNLNPEDKITPFENYSYDSKINVYGTDRSTNEIVDVGTVMFNYNYKKSNGEFSSLQMNIVDAYSFPANLESVEGYDATAQLANRISNWFPERDFSGYSFDFNQKTEIYTPINNLDCKISVSPSREYIASDVVYRLNISIESDDIYGIVNVDIVSEEDELEYDLEGNIIKKDKTEVTEEKTEEIVEEIINLEEETTETNEAEEIILNEEESSSDSGIIGGKLSDL